MADRRTVNPLLEPGGRIRVRVVGRAADGTETPIADEHVTYRVRSLYTSGDATAPVRDADPTLRNLWSRRRYAL